MRQMDRYPFIFAAVLFVLAWILGLPVRAQSAPLQEIHCTLIRDAESGAALYQHGVCDPRVSPKGLATRAAFLKDLPQLVE